MYIHVTKTQHDTKYIRTYIPASSVHNNSNFSAGLRLLCKPARDVLLFSLLALFEFFFLHF